MPGDGATADQHSDVGILLRCRNVRFFPGGPIVSDMTEPRLETAQSEVEVDARAQFLPFACPRIGDS